MQYKHFSVEERERIQEMLWGKTSLRSIARALGRSHTSVGREVARYNRGRPYQYTPRLAHERALEKRKSRGRKDRLKNETIRSYVVTHLKARWSPEQIAGRMQRDGIGMISHEAIYQFVYAQIHRGGCGLLRPGHEDLRPYLRRKRTRRMHKGSRAPQRILTPYGKSIDDRPRVVDRRTRVGDWESDTVESCRHQPGLNTLLERKTGVYLVTKVKDRTSAGTVEAIRARLEGLPVRTITFDNGSENQGWRELERALSARTFFAHPYHSWERGANENANGLLREYFPKKTDFREVPEEDIAHVEYALNMRPRKRLGWRTPLEVWSGAISG